IAMHAGLGMSHELVQGFVKLGWRLEHRVAQREIVDVVSTVLLLEFNALFKHAADPGRGLHMLTHALCYGHGDDALLIKACRVGFAQGCAKSVPRASEKITLD